ncbi:substrate-binding domain-containing protein [Phycicoccus endophyticus]|uniref:Substrate-binding domain-containing protein n=1 Tax=Phycicoccus endophyticus TaxID=1690220 RepID=A0A7G9R2A0_9MICO|nr:substrate-binding domain-containing protein [Phycicoccus endophyticus]NHI19609.1 substrate-binding domain-containing protein [Phycicoccus endophyticus]QNN49725.1 substrate-binding domain-containing protein [Phycicoccus endophyticus]GGL34534.1 LacI family transcriptional regulator [Phycicoccus endophyticus]
MKRVLPRGAAVALAISPLFLVAACGSDTSGSGSSAEDTGGGTTKVAAVIKGLDNQFFQTMRDGILDEAKSSGVDVEVQAAQSITDTTGQAEKLSALAQQDYGCYVVNPITGNNLVQGLAQIAAKDVPIVNIDRPVDADAADAAGLTLTTYIGTDNVAAAELDGKEMVKQLGGTGTVAIIGGVAGDVTSNDRVEGFTNATKGTLTLLPVVAADWDRQKALTAATDLMQAHPDLVGIFAANDDMGLGAAKAVTDAGKTGDIKVMSLDGNTDAIEAVQSGQLAATVAQYPYAVGQLGVQACEAAIAGRSVPEDIKAPVALITQDEAADALAKFPAPFKEFDNPLPDLG